MRIIIFLFLSLNVLLGCTSKEINIEHLEGYWEIDEVVTKQGEKRDYTVNLTIDYFEVKNDSSGFRKKLKPKLDGSFETSNKLEKINIVDENDDVIIHYKTPMMQWSEQLLELSQNRLILQNEQGIRYIYKRFNPINLE